MFHTNEAELQLLVSTFSRVWRSGGPANLNLTTREGQCWARLDIQLGPPGAPRPGAPEAQGGPGVEPQEPGAPPRPHPPRHPHHRQRNRRKGPSAQARDSRRREEWMRKHEEQQQEQPALDIQHVETNSEEMDQNIPASTADVPEDEPNSKELETSGSDAKSANELSCELCEYESETDVGLRIHIGRKHKKIPQLDGESDSVRDTDRWWEKHLYHTIKTYQVYIDVLSDIEESSLLSEDEKKVELKRANETRKQAFGANYKSFPPWDRM